jgi:hypothetical protein
MPNLRLIIIIFIFRVYFTSEDLRLDCSNSWCSVRSIVISATILSIPNMEISLLSQRPGASSTKLERPAELDPRNNIGKMGNFYLSQ